MDTETLEVGDGNRKFNRLGRTRALETAGDEVSKLIIVEAARRHGA